jgi:hypothetical protein
MTAQAQDRMFRAEAWTYKEFTLAAGYVAYKGAQANLILATGEVRPGVAVAGTVAIGTFFEKVDATLAAALCTVDFGREVQIERYSNATAGAALTATDVGQLCYCVDDQTVGKLPAGPVVGVVWEVSATKGVAVERLAGLSSVASGRVTLAAPAFVANDSVITAALLDTADVLTAPATGAASTITLPAAARAGQTVTIVANGTLNAHQISVRDATGPTTLVTIAAAARAQIVCRFDGTIWYAVASVASSTEVSGRGVGAVPAFVANASTVSAALVDAYSVLTVPATAGASVITLPAGARAGQSVVIVADGTLNAHTITINDATGPTAITAALTLSKRLHIECTFDGTLWYAAPVVGP